ncbi:hypothetical protein GCM10009801_78330 [Streptomyces albiaxialis]|uniref:Secreted protein n=1 Tax=Streptomyces albiaxialis TaxID=329523 RepID=A0ABN2X507_9ACTN
METVIASAIAVLGTLFGAGLTHVFQLRAAARTEEFARNERLRQERLDAYSAYAGALVNYRRAVVHRWYCEHEDPPPSDPDEAKVRTYDLRSAAQEALFRVRMLTDDAVVRERAEAAFGGIEVMHRSGDREVLDRRRGETRAAIDAFVDAARTHTRVTQPLPVGPSPSPSSGS